VKKPIKDVVVAVRLLSQKYDELYARAEAVLKEFNPCEVCKTKRGVECFDTVRNTKLRGAFGINRPNLLCCNGCEFHNRKVGCTAEKPLMCKVWVCSTLRTAKPEVAKKLDIIGREARPYGFISVMRADKPMALEYAIRLLFRNNAEREVKTAPILMSQRFTL
jgi:hypothetical protein